MTERLWCTACGTVTRDQVCDCNRYGKTEYQPQFVNYADAMQEAAHEQAQELAEAIRLIESLLGLELGSSEAALAFIEKHSSSAISSNKCK